MWLLSSPSPHPRSLVPLLPAQLEYSPGSFLEPVFGLCRAASLVTAKATLFWRENARAHRVRAIH